MKKQLEQIREFHNAVHERTGSWLATLNQSFEAGNPTANLRADLIIEEAEELCEALKEGTKADVLKEACDLLYVVFGTIIAYNLPIKPAFDIVHADNMGKLLNGTVGKNGKFLKPAGWKKVDLTALLEIQKEIEIKKQELQYEFFDYTKNSNKIS